MNFNCTVYLSLQGIVRMAESFPYSDEDLKGVSSTEIGGYQNSKVKMFPAKSTAGFIHVLRK